MSRSAAKRRCMTLVAGTLLCTLGNGCHYRRSKTLAVPVTPSDSTAPVVPGLPRIPRDAARFEIDVVDDSTATFRIFEARWLRAGMFAYAVDPANRDALVARLTITKRDAGSASALVTSQVTRVSAAHFLLVPRPRAVWWRTRQFWLSAAAGSVAGAGLAVTIR